MHSEIMAELRAIRAQMARNSHTAHASMSPGDAVVAQEVADTRAMLETYRAQIEQCEKLKVELDLIHDAINRTKREIAVLHGKSFNGEEMAKVNGELGAVVGGTEQATQQILEAAESIDQAASALSKVDSVDQQKRLADDSFLDANTFAVNSHMVLPPPHSRVFLDRRDLTRRSRREPLCDHA